MAKRLIDANSFVIEELLDRDKTEYLDTFVDGVRATMKAIRTAPTVPAAEVVKCKNCKHFMTDALGQQVCNRTFMMFHMGADDFCSYGEHKEKENNNGQETNRFRCIDPAGAANGKPRKPRRN